MAGRLLPQPQPGGRPKSVALLEHAPDVERDLDIAAATVGSLQALEALPESERELWVARHHRSRNECQTCGRQQDECSHPTTRWYSQRTVCRATMERQAADRRYEELHKAQPFHDGTFKSWAEEASSSHPFHFRDGVRIWVAAEDVNPGDHFTTRVNASPWATPDDAPAPGATADNVPSRGHQQRGG